MIICMLLDKTLWGYTGNWFLPTRNLQSSRKDKQEMNIAAMCFGFPNCESRDNNIHLIDF